MNCVRVFRGLAVADEEELKLGYFGGVGGTQDVQADSGGGLGGEAFDALVADGVACGDGFPTGAVPDFDAEGLNVLAVVEALHDQGVIEGYGLAKFTSSVE